VVNESFIQTNQSVLEEMRGSESLGLCQGGSCSILAMLYHHARTTFSRPTSAAAATSLKAELMGTCHNEDGNVWCG